MIKSFFAFAVRRFFLHLDRQPGNLIKLMYLDYLSVIIMYVKVEAEKPKDTYSYLPCCGKEEERVREV